MSDVVLVSIIAAMSAVMVALITGMFAMLVQIGRRTKETHDQVTNDHSTNLRVEQDERHKENVAAIGGIRAAMRTGFRLLSGRVGVLEDRLGIVEDTMPHPQRRTP